MKNIIESINELDAWLQMPQAEIRDYIKQDLQPIEQSYLFHKLTVHFDPAIFILLFDLGAFDLSQIPKPINITDDDGKVRLAFTTWEGCFIIHEASKFNSEDGVLTNIIIGLIDTYIEHVLSESNLKDRNFTCDYNYCRSILLLPLEEITEKHLSFIKAFGLKPDRFAITRVITDKFFKRLLTERNKRLIFYFLDIFFSVDEDSKDFKIKSIVDDYHLENFVKRIPPDLYNALGDEVVNWSLKKLQTLSQHYDYYFLKFNIASLEPDPQNSLSGGVNFAIVNLVTNLLILEDPELLSNRISAFFNTGESIIHRISFYLIDKFYEELCGYFWSLDNPLEIREAKLEIYRLLKRNCSLFTKNEVEKVLLWIEELQFEHDEKETVSDSQRYEAYQKLEWLIALEPIHYKFKESLINRYNELKIITEGQTPKHPGYDSYFSIGPGSKFSVTKKLTNLTTEQFLNTLANPASWDGYNIYGLQKDVSDYVLQQTSLIIDNISKFQYIPITFLYNLVDGFCTLASKENTLNWTIVYDFFTVLIRERDDLWDFSDDTQHNKSNAVGMIAWLIYTNASNTKNKVTVDIIRKGIDLLITMEGRYKGDFIWLNNDHSFDIINSTRGKLYQAMITSSLREIEIDKTHGIYWNNRVKDLFTKRVSDQSLITEFYWSAGFFTPQIGYLDMNWLANFKDDLFIDRKELSGDAAFNGYLLLSPQLYTNIFQLLIGNYQNAINKLTEAGSITKKLVEHIEVAYLTSKHDADKLMENLLESKHFVQMKYLIASINYNVNLLDDQKLAYLWKNILKLIEQNNTSQLRKALVGTVEYIGYVKIMTNEFLQMFQTAILMADQDIPTYNIIKIIQNKFDKGLYTEGGQILLILLSNKKLNFSFDNKDITDLLTKLYENKQKDIADKISIVAVERMNFEVINTYNQYQH